MLVKKHDIWVQHIRAMQALEVCSRRHPNADERPCPECIKECEVQHPAHRTTAHYPDFFRTATPNVETQ